MGMAHALSSLAAGILLAGCAGSGAPPSGRPAGSLPTEDAPASWSQIVEAAKREGQVAVMSQIGSATSDALAGAFQQAHPDITVDYTGMSGAQMVTKLLNERAAGLYSTDVVVYGTTSIINGLLREGVLDPLQPALIGPDNSDPSKWRDGRLSFADEAGQFNLIFLGGIKIPFIYSPGLVSASEFTSFNDVLDPKWKGKIAMLDPQVAGSGLGSAAFWYSTPGLGKEFLRRLFKEQDVVFTKDDRQLTDWVARGQYAIGLASSDFIALDLRARGVPIESLPAETLKEGTYMTAAWGTVGLMNRAPHPNAARVYLNWLLSKAGQEVVAQAAGYPSRRADASTEGLREPVIPKPGVQYRELNKEIFLRQQDEVIAYVKTLIPD